MIGPHQVIKGWPGPDPRLKLDASPTFELIETKRVKSDMTSGAELRFGGLNGDRDILYQIVYHRGEAGATATAEVYVNPNGLQTNQSGSRLTVNGATVSGAAVVRLQLVNGARQGLSIGYFYAARPLDIASGADRRGWLAWNQSDDAFYIMSGRWADRDTLVNFLELDPAGSFVAGAVASLYRIRP